jgi:hypothetical protein
MPEIIIIATKQCQAYTRYHSKCLISVGAKNDLGKAFIINNGCSLVQMNNAT